MAHTLRVAAVLLLCAGLMVGCGSSREFSSAQRAAIRAAQRQDGTLRIFPGNEQGPVRCRPAGRGNPWSHRITNGRCTTFVSLYGKWPEIDFIQQFRLVGHPEQGGTLVILDPQNRIVGEHERGLLPYELR
jgi:hypothetical protein